MRKKRKHLKGFSLGEVLLSIAVLVSGILPIFASLSRGYRTSIDGRNLIIASGLAQEGVELLQNVRNNSLLQESNSDFSVWLPDSGTSWDDCRIDILDPALDDPADRISCGQSSFDLVEGADGMTHTGGSGMFKRRIFLDYDGSTETLDVVSAVYWGGTEPGTFADVRNDCVSANRCTYAETRLSPWR